MKKILLLWVCTMTLGLLQAQEVIEIPYEEVSGIIWENGEKSFFSEIWDTEVITNVSAPTLTVFRPEKPNGTAVIVAPGGGLYALSITREGTAVAEWLAQKGITAFVLKYRLVPTGDDGVREITDEGNSDPMKIEKRVAPVLPLSIADGVSAVCYVREHAENFNIDPDKIGFMGFSAGGAVTMGVGYHPTQEGRPDFLVPVYPWMDVIPVQEVPEKAPPMLVVCASDDPLGLAKGSIALYSSWLEAGKSVALQMFAKGGHGFGMKKQNLPSDNWIQRFYEWALAEELLMETEEQ